MAKIVQDHQIVKIDYLVEDNFIIQLYSPIEIPEIEAGNFAEIQIPGTPDVFLRRPFSILDVDYKNRLISFYIKAIGKGTKQLGDLNIGDKVNIIYPLGNKYTIPKQAKNVLVVGGGSGIAPFILLGKQLQKHNVEVTFLIGGRSKKDILLTNEFSKYGEVTTTTEDGSYGEKGLVTHHSIFNNKNFPFDKVYTCGPDPMMKAVGLIAMEKGIECEVSLENTMACGFGVCLCCVTPTQKGNKRVCLEGPVFNVKELVW